MVDLQAVLLLVAFLVGIALVRGKNCFAVALGTFVLASTIASALVLFGGIK